MAKITVRTTPRELLDLGLWEAACEEIGWSVYILNEGLIEDDHIVSLTWEQATRIGLLGHLAAREQRGEEE